MANYKKLTDVEVMEEVSESTMALVEENGTLKKVPCGKGFGGGDNPIKYTAIMVDLPQNSEFHCENMTFDEAFNHLRNGEIVDFILRCHFYDTFVGWSRAICVNWGQQDSDKYIELVFMYGFENLIQRYWTPDGWFETAPGMPI